MIDSISINEWPAGVRPCSFSLCLQDGDVFADFLIDSQKRISLLRISYDGYGCCNPNAPVSVMSEAESAALVVEVDKGELDTAIVLPILQKYLKVNADRLWPDALEDHGLIEPGVTPQPQADV